MNSDYLTAAQVAAKLSISKRMVYKLIAQGTLPSVTITPNCVRVKQSDLDRFIESRSRTHADAT